MIIFIDLIGYFMFFSKLITTFAIQTYFVKIKSNIQWK